MCLCKVAEAFEPFSLSVHTSFCGGLYRDIKRKLPWVCSDFYEGFHIQSISAVLFIYLGCITNAITFGGLLGDATDNYQVKHCQKARESQFNVNLIQ